MLSKDSAYAGLIAALIAVEVSRSPRTVTETRETSNHSMSPIPAHGPAFARCGDLWLLRLLQRRFDALALACSRASSSRPSQSGFNRPSPFVEWASLTQRTTIRIPLMDSDDALNGTVSDRKLVYEFELDQAFTEDRCFLCGATLTKGNRTDEHVFPRWMQQQFELWDQKLTLNNGTTIPYRQLTIPCCSTCNNHHLAPIEDRVKIALAAGVAGINALDRTDLFVWLGKIYYGLLFRDLFLHGDRRNPKAGTLVTQEYLKQFRMHHMLLQVARGVVRWPSEQHPASVFVFEAQLPSRAGAQFDYRDSLFFPFLSIRLGGVAIVASLQDWGSLRSFVDIPMFNVASRIALHPKQFRQVHAMGMYMASRMNRTPHHMTIGHEEVVEIVTLPIGGMSRKPLFDDFVLADYARVLAESFDQPISEIFDGQKVVDIIGRDAEPFVLPSDADDCPALGF